VKISHFRYRLKVLKQCLKLLAMLESWERLIGGMKMDDRKSEFDAKSEVLLCSMSKCCCLLHQLNRMGKRTGWEMNGSRNRDAGFSGETALASSPQRYSTESLGNVRMVEREGKATGS
jgi:hypothetical protein